MHTIQVFIADDHAVLRTGVRLLLQTQDDMQVVGEAGDFAAALSQLKLAQPDVVTLDLSMPGGLGLSAIEKIHALAPRSRVIVLTMHDDPAYVRSALAMGAAGYVAKTAAGAELISAIRAVCAGRVFVDARSTAASGTPLPVGASIEAESQFNALSPRELEALGLIAQGHTNRAVAERLDVSVKTVESYRSRAMAKLGLKNRADLTRFAISHGMLGSGPIEPAL